jgi:hypothetical protein
LYEKSKKLKPLTVEKDGGMMDKEDNLLGMCHDWDNFGRKKRPPKPPGPVVKYGVVAMYAVIVERI